MSPPLLPLFPLSLVLLPEMALPLHIFEERYKEMMADVIPSSAEFGIVLAKNEGIVNVGCTAVVKTVFRRYEDGRLDLLVNGRRRFIIGGLDQEKSYLRAEVEFIEDDHDAERPGPELGRRALAAFAPLFTESKEDAGTIAPGAADLSFRLADRIEDLDKRQAVLTMRSETERLEFLLRVLPEYLIKQERTELAPARDAAKWSREAHHYGLNAMMADTEQKHLIFDADDTLWENNIYFESAFTQFCEYLKHSSMTAEQIRAVLDEIEIVNAKIHGYGSRNFARNLVACFEHLAERDIAPRDIETVKQFAYAILEKPIELIEGVAETVAALYSRHELTVFTKGDPEEQRLKIDRSGLGHFFKHTAIVREKHEAAYRELTEERGFAPQRTWMIGNSPKSDINPALAAGLNAVFVPHPNTWRLEHEEVPENHPRLMKIANVRELQTLF